MASQAALMLLVGLLSSGVWAKEPPAQPVLRIETGIHTARISRISTDSLERFVVTGSDDKTVRVWELKTGKLLRVFRVPIQEGNEGKIFAVALSPDGQTIACGGWTGIDWDGTATVYLFDRESGRMLPPIRGLPNVINHLVFSQDGARLAVSLAGRSGVRVYRPDGHLVGYDGNYDADTYGADFDNQGRLVTTSYDGFVRLYDQNLRLLIKARLRGGKRPVHVQFSPDAAKLVVGFADSAAVSIVAASDLSLLLQPEHSDVRGALSSVAWSRDGESLYAGGAFQKGDTFWIRRWREAGRGRHVDLAGGANTLTQIIPLAKGGIAYATADPSWGIIDSTDKAVISRTSAVLDFRDSSPFFRASSDLGAIEFSTDPRGKEIWTLSVLNRLLEDRREGKSGFFAPRLSIQGMELTDVVDSPSPSLNGAEIRLLPYERAYSGLVLSKNRQAVLGTTWYLRLLTADATEVWSTRVPGAVLALNAAGNEKMMVAALSDGTIRWYRASDGVELVAVFADKGKRWVAWTPHGNYMAGPNGEDLIGWQLNNGKDAAAEFVPASKFRNLFYSPDVIEAVLTGGNLDQIVNEQHMKDRIAGLRERMPPALSIVEPQDGADVSNPKVSLKVSLKTTREDAATNMKVLIDGRPVAATRGVRVVGQKRSLRELEVIVPERDAEIAVLAEDAYGVSEPAVVRLKWRGPTRASEFSVKPKLYVLAIGISHYLPANFSLELAAKDARDFVHVLEEQKGVLYRDVVKKLLTDETATKDEVLDGFDWIRRETTSKDVAVIFLAGHGINDQNGVYYFLPSNGDPERLMRTGVPWGDIKNTVSSIAGKALVFVDTCHSGNVMGRRRAIPDVNRIVNELSSAENGAVVFAASTGTQYSLEDDAWGNGAFTKALIEGLRGKADYMKSGRITINMLDLYLSERVKELTNGLQTPTTTKPETISDFPVVLISN